MDLAVISPDSFTRVRESTAYTGEGADRLAESVLAQPWAGVGFASCGRATRVDGIDITVGILS